MSNSCFALFSISISGHNFVSVGILTEKNFFMVWSFDLILGEGDFVSLSVT